MPIWEIYYRRAFYIHSQELWNATQRAKIQIERQQLVRHTRSVATRFNFLSRKWSEPCHETYSTIKIKRLGFWRSPHYHGSRVGKQAKCISSDREARRKMHHNEMGVSSCRRASLHQSLWETAALQHTDYGENAHNSLRHTSARGTWISLSHNGKATLVFVY